jgi:ribosomal protein S18 acetylase RimI-like enzyme
MKLYQAASDRDQALAVLRALLARGPVPYTPHPGEWDWWVYHADPRDQIEAFIGSQALAEAVVNHAEVAAFGLAIEDVIELGRKQLPGVRFTVTHVSLADHARVEALRSRGFEVERPPAQLFERSTAGAKPLPVDGFEIRSLDGEREHASRADAARLAFASTLAPEVHRARYLQFMRSPGYVLEHDLVAVAPDGTIASFEIYWLDAELSLGQFEPVGTHPNFQRRGLARALLHEGLARLASAGIERARVMTGGSNERAKRAYLDAGFDLVDEVGAFRAPASFAR